jgi:hypothetical protein
MNPDDMYLPPEDDAYDKAAERRWIDQVKSLSYELDLARRENDRLRALLLGISVLATERHPAEV